MNLLLADTCFEPLFNLPKLMQRKVQNFITKFRNNPNTLGIHLEPIAQFKNSSLRTARIDDNYRAIVAEIDKENYALLYVAAHEEAYRWGENKRCAWNEYTQAIQVIPVVETEAETNTLEYDYTPNTNAFFAGVPEDKLLRIGIPQETIARVLTIADLNDLDKLEPILPTDAFENIFNIMEGTNIDDVISDIEEGFAPEGNDKLLSINNKRKFMAITNDEDLQRIIEQGMDKWQIFLHPSQRKLVDAEYKSAMKVSGGAGTGKTIAAIHRLKYLCKKNNANVLFTTYTKTLSTNIAHSINKMGIPTQRYTLKNIDSVLLDVAKKHNIKTGYQVQDYLENYDPLKLWREVLLGEISEFDEQFLHDEYINVIAYNGNSDAASYMMQPRTGRSKSLSRKQRLAVWRLTEKYLAIKQARRLVDRLELFNDVTNYLNQSNIHPYTNVIVDEFQDFSNPELKFVRALAPEGANDLFLVGDPLQRIYTNRRMNFGAAGINIKGVRSRKLKINYRTTEPIKRAAISVVKGIDFDDLDGGIESTQGYVSLIHHGTAPIYRIAPNAQAEGELVLQWLNECLNNGIAPSDICISAPKRQIIKDVQSVLHGNGIDHCLLEDGLRKGNHHGVALCTFHSLKGLEFRAIILMGVNGRNLPVQATAQPERAMANRSLLYVAITRARELVYITGYGEPCGLIEPQ